MRKKILTGLLAVSILTGYQEITLQQVPFSTKAETLQTTITPTNSAVSSTNITNQEVTYLAFASDRHGDTSAIANAMGAMPSNVGYVGILGDLIGGSSGGGHSKSSSSSVNSSDIYKEIKALNCSTSITQENASILWASHDEKLNDDCGIVFGKDGSNSGLMYTGKNADGSLAYYVYGIAFNDMKNAENAKTAAKTFETWVDTITDHSIPIFVCSHVPLHYARKDNKGASAWNLALNYAATGYETTEASAVVSRNVIFLFGHNHTVESKTDHYSGEFYISCESEMEIGAKENVWSRIFYTYTTAGYLKQNHTTTLISINSKEIKLDKYQDSNLADDFYDSQSKSSGIYANQYETAGSNTITKVSADAESQLATSKATNPILVRANKTTIKYTALKKSNQTLATTTVATIRNKKGTLSYKKNSGNKNITVNTKTGKITVAKGLSKGTYKIKYKITVSGNKYYKKANKTLTISIKVS